jgi:heme exporter protein D
VNWSGVADFVAMGGYGLYVWGSFVVTAAGIGWEAVMLRQRRASALRQVRDWRLLNEEDSRDAAR